MIKFKFINRKFDLRIKKDFEHYTIVDNPIDCNNNNNCNYNFPDGEYLIRGDKKSHSKTYFHAFNNWYLVENVTRDNGHFMVQCTTYKLYPQLSEKEWIALSKVPYKCLNPVWQRYLNGYMFDMELRKLKRDSRKIRIRIIGR